MDDLTRQMIVSGELARRVAEEDLRGITSIPTIFDKAITSGSEYDSDERPPFSARGGPGTRPLHSSTAFLKIESY
jgi:hypothetical protein